MDDDIQRRLRHQQATPFARAIGLELAGWGSGFANTVLPPSPPIRLHAGTTQIHPWALIGMADHAISYAFTAVIPADAGMSTIDLRLDFGPAPRGKVMAEARLRHLTAQNGNATLTSLDEAGNCPITATALFNFRAFPGGGSEMKRPDLPRFVNDHDGPFEDFLALIRAPDLHLAGGTRRTIGFEGLPARHGGVIGALLAAACEAACDREKRDLRLASLQIRFLRPGGPGPLFAHASVARAGRSAAFVNATCFHAEAQPVAEAQASFVPKG